MREILSKGMKLRRRFHNFVIICPTSITLHCKNLFEIEQLRFFQFEFIV